jgi:hypothetical protein
LYPFEAVENTAKRLGSDLKPLLYCQSVTM